MSGLLVSTHRAGQFNRLHDRLATEVAGADYETFQLEQAVGSLLGRSDRELLTEHERIRETCRLMLRRLDRITRNAPASPVLMAAE